MDIERSALLARDRLTDAAVRAAQSPAKEHAVRARLAELKSVAK
jgi:hypothetical protein